MKLSISNIAWDKTIDNEVYGMMQKYGYSGLEIAPTRVFPYAPYKNLPRAATWYMQLKSEWGFCISSMQSVWYGRDENMFRSVDEREKLIQYTQCAIDFAEVIECKNIVFGCPKNRTIPKGCEPWGDIAFFRIVGDHAAAHGTIIGMEANPHIYGTNYINDTGSAIRLIEQVDSKGFKLNLDAGTMIENGEALDIIRDKSCLINHVHISEPQLRQIVKRPLHKEISEMLYNENFKGYVSIEMAKKSRIADIETTMDYIKSVFS